MVIAETLIQFETAMLANQKGFPKSNIPHGYSFDGKYADDMFFGKIEYQAPTQSLLQKWLREVHNIDVIVETDNNGSKFYKVRIWENGNDNIGYFTSFTTYEEALEVGLKEALTKVNKK